MKSTKSTGPSYLFYLSLGALGVVFGDIGTSPLYAIRECFVGSHAVPLNVENVLGVLSLIFWSLILVVGAKYITVVMRADNRGEGGVLALMALANRENKNSTPDLRQQFLVLVGLFGAALLYGDGVITPAITVLSSVEGLKVGTPLFEPYVLPIACVILVGLFVVQRYGTAKIGAVFGPILLVWFLTLGVMGLHSILLTPSVIEAVNPLHAVDFFRHNGWHGFAVLGSVFLVTTGGEALYADMGHFGRVPIRYGWWAVVFPSLFLNYLGQGALLLRTPAAIENPFFYMAPQWGLYPLVIMATIAASIASQAVISGAFSLTRQAVQLGYLPRMVIKHTSSEEIGQIYVPRINWLLFLGTIWLVFEFRTSSNLAAAYGIAVSTTMVITTLLIYVVSRDIWKWNVFRALAIMVFFLAIDTAFFSANIVKIAQGGWFPLAMGALIFTLMTTWRKGRQILWERLRSRAVPLESFLKEIDKSKPTIVEGAAVFMSGTLEGTPPALLHNVKHNKVIHEKNIIMLVATEDVPHVPIAQRITIETVKENFYRIVAHYGFTDTPNVPGVLQLARAQGLDIRLSEATFFLGRETLLATGKPGMAIWREQLFAAMTANAQRATTFFQIPPEQVIEIGIEVEM